MADLIDSIIGKAKQKSTGVKKDEVVWYPEKDLSPFVIKLVEAGYVSNILAPIFKSRQDFVAEKLFDIFVNKMWSEKTVPSNPRIVIKKAESDARDMAFMFIVKFRKDAISKILPAPSELKDGQKPIDVLVELLVKSVGLSLENANKITDEENGEFQIVNNLDLVASFNTLYYSENAVKRSAATKILSYINGTLQKGKKKLDLEPFTEEEQSILEVEQLLTIKENFLQRAFLYCENVDQLRNLLKFVKVSLVCQNYEYAIGEEPSERNNRIEKAVKEMLTVE
jgi:hypothetical protein